MKYVLLLTACISPNGMCQTRLTDAEVRKQQYIEALQFYLKAVKYPIAFVENTGVDISGGFKSYIESGRLEVLTFRGNDYDRVWARATARRRFLIMLCSIPGWCSKPNT